MNETCIAMAARIAHRLKHQKLLTDINFAASLNIIGEFLQEELFPTECPHCGAPNCPQCMEHLEPPVENPTNDNEKLALCLNCEIYVRPDDTLVPVADPPTKDSRLSESGQEKKPVIH